MDDIDEFCKKVTDPNSHLTLLAALVSDLPTDTRDLLVQVANFCLETNKGNVALATRILEVDHYEANKLQRILTDKDVFGLRGFRNLSTHDYDKFRETSTGVRKSTIPWCTDSFIKYYCKNVVLESVPSSATGYCRKCLDCEERYANDVYTHNLYDVRKEPYFTFLAFFGLGSGDKPELFKNHLIENGISAEADEWGLNAFAVWSFNGRRAQE